MGLIKCADCGHDLSQAATRCQHCGAPNYHRRQVWIQRLGFAVAALGGIVMLCLLIYGATFDSRMESEARAFAQEQADVEWARLRQIAIDAKAQEDAEKASHSR